MKSSSELNAELAQMLRDIAAKVDAENANVWEMSEHSCLAQREKRGKLRDWALAESLRFVDTPRAQASQPTAKQKG